MFLIVTATSKNKSQLKWNTFIYFFLQINNFIFKCNDDVAQNWAPDFANIRAAVAASCFLENRFLLMPAPVV